MPETTINPIEVGRKLVDEFGADRVEWRKGGDAAKLYVGDTVAGLALPQKRKAAIRLHVYDAALPKSLVKGLDAKSAGRGDAKKATNITIESAEQARKVRPILEHAAKGRAKAQDDGDGERREPAPALRRRRSGVQNVTELERASA